MNEQSEQILKEHKRVIHEAYRRGFMAAAVPLGIIAIVQVVQNYQLVALITDLVITR